MINYDKVVLFGDINIHIDDPSNTLACDFFKYGPNHGHTLDLIFTLGVKVSILECLDIPISDHKCITFTCELQSATYVPPCVVCTRTLNEQSTPKFCAFFSHNAAEILKSPHLNEMVDRFNYLCSSTLELLLSKIEAK